jgi:hypothetical protein
MSVRARAVFQVREALNRFQKEGMKGSQLKTVSWPDIASEAPNLSAAITVTNKWKKNNKSSKLWSALNQKSRCRRK